MTGLLARLTRGRWGTGRWTAGEVADIRRRATSTADRLRPYVE